MTTYKAWEIEILGSGDMLQAIITPNLVAFLTNYSNNRTYSEMQNRGYEPNLLNFVKASKPMSDREERMMQYIMDKYKNLRIVLNINEPKSFFSTLSGRQNAALSKAKTHIDSKLGSFYDYFKKQENL